ncbi:MAG: hypothetical protein GF355_11150, partial [Candidatus Eisenbacteria bacterium]|nr:hypothetical protein [Candidatus Eisenbacteria bacterium]
MLHKAFRKHGTSGVILILAAVLIWTGCEKRHEIVTSPIDPAGPGPVPPELTGFAVEVGNRSATLAWELADSSNVGEVHAYIVWLSEGISGSYIKVDSVDAPPATLTGLDNGQAYRAAVRSVMAGGLRSRLSREISFTPALFSIAIEG